ncbi:MAG: response regulator transcription factor [Verrucomicrobia bacterium]|nr:response regulator transcription factor [Verrucomicrobiota bacterium]
MSSASSFSASKRPPVRVALVDDSELVRLGLRSLLGLQPTLIQVVAEAASVAEAVAVVPASRPDVVLMDMRLPDGNGVQACRRLREIEPELRVLFLTSAISDELVADSIRAGGSGYLLKEVNGQSLIQAVLDVAAGGKAHDPAVSAHLREVARLGPRAPQLTNAHDNRLLALLTAGKTNKEIGNELGLAEKTVKNQLTVLFDKLGIDRRAQAAAYFVRQQQQAGA